MKQVEPKRTQKAKAAPKRKRQVTQNIEETVLTFDDGAAMGLRRSKRAKQTNSSDSQVGITRYELSCRKSLGKRKRKLSPIKETKPKPELGNDNRATAAKKRRVADKSKQVTKKKGKKTKNKKKQTIQKTATHDAEPEPVPTFDDAELCQIVKDLGWFDDLCDTKALPKFVNHEGVYRVLTNRSDTVQVESTSFNQIRYIPEGKIDYGFFPGVDRKAGVMRFHKGAVKATSITENLMKLEVLRGSFEIWQGKKSMTVTPGLIIMQPGTSYAIKYTESTVGVILFHIIDKDI